MKPLASRPGGALSGGEQHAGLARALVARPRLLLDEPTEGIQPSIIDEIVDKLKELRARLGLTIVQWSRTSTSSASCRIVCC